MQAIQSAHRAHRACKFRARSLSLSFSLSLILSYLEPPRRARSLSRRLRLVVCLPACLPLSRDHSVRKPLPGAHTPLALVPKAVLILLLLCSFSLSLSLTHSLHSSLAFTTLSLTHSLALLSLFNDNLLLLLRLLTALRLLQKSARVRLSCLFAAQARLGRELFANRPRERDNRASRARVASVSESQV